MPATPKRTSRVSKTNRFSGAGPEPPKSNPAPSSIVPLESSALALVVNELTTARQRVDTLEKQLADEQAGRRSDIERLLREQTELHVRIATLEAQQGKADAG